MKRISGMLGGLLLVLLTGASGHAGEKGEAPLRLLVFGDSLVAGYGLEPEESFPGQLERSLRDAGYHVEVIGAGVSGDTTSAGLDRLDWSLADRPDAAIIVLGGNDALRGLPPEQTRRNLDLLIGRLKQAEVAVLLAGMRAPRNLGSDYYSKFDRLYPELAAKHDVLLYRFFLENVATVAEYNLGDGIHPNAAGVRVIVRRMLPQVERLLQRALEDGAPPAGRP